MDVELLEPPLEDVLELPLVPDVLEVPDDVPDELDPDDVDDPVVPDCSVVPPLVFLVAAVSAWATAEKASDPKAVAVSRLPVTNPTRRKP